MNRGLVEQLAQLHGVPAVSISFPLDTRRPGNLHDSGLLRDLGESAAGQVRATVSGRAATSLVSRIDATLSEVDLDHPTPGVAVFVSPDVTRIIPLDSPVEPEVVVGERFAIRGLLTAFLHRRHVRVVVLSQAKTRCIDLNGHEVRERFDFGFPVEIEPPVEADAPHRDFPLDEHEHAEAVKFVFRAVDDALEALQHSDVRPLVLLGAERDLAYFDEITRHGGNVIGRVHGDYERETADTIADLAQPVVDAHEVDQQDRACAEVREAIGSRAVAGIVDTWKAARDGRGYRLVVEDGFRYPALVVDDALEPARVDDPDRFDAVENAIEEVVRHRGDVVVVRPDDLADLGSIALITRY